MKNNITFKNGTGLVALAKKAPVKCAMPVTSRSINRDEMETILKLLKEQSKQANAALRHLMELRNRHFPMGKVVSKQQNAGYKFTRYSSRSKIV